MLFLFLSALSSFTSKKFPGVISRYRHLLCQLLSVMYLALIIVRKRLTELWCSDCQMLVKYCRTVRVAVGSIWCWNGFEWIVGFCAEPREDTARWRSSWWTGDTSSGNYVHGACIAIRAKRVQLAVLCVSQSQPKTIVVDTLQYGDPLSGNYKQLFRQCTHHIG